VGSCTFEVGSCGWAVTGSRYWRRGTSTPSSSTGAARAADGTWFYFLETSSPSRAGTVSYLVSPALASVRSVSFKYHMHGKSMGTLSVEACLTNCVSSSAKWRLLWTKRGQQQPYQSSTWRLSGAVALPAGTKRMRFRGLAGSPSTSDMSIDTIAFQARARYCAVTIQAFGTKAAAEIYCARNSPANNGKCTGVYDEKCDSKGVFYACADKGAFPESSENSCVYTGTLPVLPVIADCCARPTCAAC